MPGQPGRAAARRALPDRPGRALPGAPGLGGYDVWNECNIPRATATARPRRRASGSGWRRATRAPAPWATAWRRHSFAAWADVEPPRALAPYPEVLDWLRFRIDNAYRLMRWRVATLRAADPDHPVVAHGIASQPVRHGPRGLRRVARGRRGRGLGLHLGRPRARATSRGSSGTPSTWSGRGRGGTAPGRRRRTAAPRRGRAGRPGPRPSRSGTPRPRPAPLWMQPQVPGRPREDGRIAEPEDVRLWNLSSFAGGATGCSTRAGARCWTAPCSAPSAPTGWTARARRARRWPRRVARWATAPEQAALWRARPVRRGRGHRGGPGEPALLLRPAGQHGLLRPVRPRAPTRASSSTTCSRTGCTSTTWTA